MIFIFGWNPVAEFIIDELSEASINIDGIIIDDDRISKRDNYDFETIPFSKIQLNTNDTVYNCIGYRELQRRVEVGEILEKTGCLKSFISIKSSISRSAKIGNGVILLGDVVIERNSIIGSHSLLWGGSRVCHDASIGDGCFMASGSILGGFATLGSLSSIGFNTSVKEKCSVPPASKLGANRFISQASI